MSPTRPSIYDPHAGGATHIGFASSTQRNALVRALAGKWVEAEMLGYQLTGSHIGVVADDPAVVESLARRFRVELLQVHTRAGRIWAWIRQPRDVSPALLEELVRARTEGSGPVAFGEPGWGPGGFCRSHEQAIEAYRIALATGADRIRFARVAPLAALIRDPEVARIFVACELGGLAADTDRCRRLRATLRVHLESGQKIAGTANLQRVARKTVHRHVYAAEELLGHWIGERSAEVLLALRLFDLLEADVELDDAVA
jgi:hypothetical protein